MRTYRTGVAAVALAVALALASTLAGCNTPQALELTAADDGSEVTIAPEQELVITLDSNPTTGYRWDLDGPLPEMVEQVGEAEYVAESTAIGAGGTETWRFRATGRGAGPLALKYWRSFEPTAPPEGTFTVVVRVE